MLQLIILVIVVNSVISNEECKYQKFSPKHSFCLPPNEQCKILESGLKEDEKNLLVQLHNEYRSKIANEQESRAGGMPPASDMLEMEWDDELASIAQKYSEQCKFEHDCQTCRQVDSFKVGQNLYVYLTTGKKDQKQVLEQAVKEWYEEVNIFNSSVVMSYEPNKKEIWDHLTQLLWSLSNKIGCGTTYFQDGKWNKLLLVCNYGPAGNILTKPMYTKGKACSACPEKSLCSKSNKGLCRFENIQSANKSDPIK